MIRISCLAVAASALALSSCGTAPKAPPVAAGGQLELALASGAYRCEGSVSIQVQREYQGRVNNRINVRWNGNSYRLERDPSYSGLPRFQDVANGLVWIDLPWKGVLLDSNSNTPLINECHPG
ncbi:MAG TPA: hypothetical protein VJ548_11960 [Azospira sp.]|nr:hypothetical protein [Azospira sp.]